MPRTLYEILGIERSAGKAAIEAAYVAQLEKLSTPAYGVDDDLSNQLVFIRSAREILTDPDHRASYDRRLERDGAHCVPLDVMPDGQAQSAHAWTVQQAANAGMTETQTGIDPSVAPDLPTLPYVLPVSDVTRVVVTDFDVSFIRLVSFFTKASLAAIPAALLLAVFVTAVLILLKVSA